MKQFSFLILLICINVFFVTAQTTRWQQSVQYVMNVDMDVDNNRFNGVQNLTYKNNSPEKLDRLFYHMYWNAFQPNSSMDVRSRELGKQVINGRQDWDGRVKDRISMLKQNEIGFQKIISLKMNGVPQKFKYHETILEVNLSKPIMPGATVMLEMVFQAQVPLQVRRSGRDNPQTGVRLSMSQWFPKICEYDKDGWHPNPYIAREFYGVWGSFEVNIKIDKTYKIGATGILTNANEIGWGYDVPGSSLKSCSTEKRTWKFKGANIHDFVWAADPDYVHLTKKCKNGPVLHVIYNEKKNDAVNDSAWANLLTAAEKVLPFIEKNFGAYPYPQYSFIQGGDGGMEYPMATLVSGPSLGTAFHEWMHSWYQMILGTNESLYAWMDEGFTSYAEDLVSKFHSGSSSLADYKNALAKNPSNESLKNLIQSLPEDHAGAYANYFTLAKSGQEEPMTTHADHYNSNFAYSIDAYSKGEVFMEQLGYIIGAENRDSLLLEYYRKWRFKHPEPSDLMRIAERKSGLELDWYREYWVNSTKTIDYAIDSLWEEEGQAKIRLKRIGLMPMPIDLKINFKDGSNELHNIPLNLMYGNKSSENKEEKFVVEESWKWTHPTYTMTVNRKLTEITKVEIDPTKRMADVARKNNLLELNW
jgi:hypothetical protein